MKQCNREVCALRLERLSASAKILADEMRKHVWYSEARDAARQIAADANYVFNEVTNDHGWEAGDR
jgi:hypothetical protein